MSKPDEIFDNEEDNDISSYGQEFITPIEEPDEDNYFESEDDEETDGPNYEFMDDTYSDIDFSEFRGDFKSSLKKLDGKIKHRKPRVKKVKRPYKPLTKEFGVKKRAQIHSKDGKKTTKRIIIPRNRKVIIEGVDKFMLSKDKCADSIKNIGYYKCKKLKELVFIFNNNSAIDFNLELFNPSMPMNYLFSTSGNINNKIQVAGGNAASYSDVLFFLLANPALIPNARLVVSGPSIAAQQNVSMQFKNKNIKGEQAINPLTVPLNLDSMQFQSTVINFDIIGTLNRPFIPDGMDVINYTVLAGNTVTFCFYYDQKILKKYLWEEAKNHNSLL